MTKLVLSNEQMREFGRTDDIEVCDPSGRHLAWFRRYNPMDDCPYTEEELRKEAGRRDGRPLADIWRDLEARGK